MRKRFKLKKKNGRIYFLQWKEEGLLFGPQWHVMASVANSAANVAKSKTIVRLMNECDSDAVTDKNKDPCDI